MGVIEIVLLIIGGAIFVLSFVLPKNKEEMDADYQSVFKRADGNMYMNKSAIKAGEGPNLEVERLQL